MCIKIKTNIGNTISWVKLLIINYKQIDHAHVQDKHFLYKK